MTENSLGFMVQSGSEKVFIDGCGPSEGARSSWFAVSIISIHCKTLCKTTDSLAMGGRDRDGCGHGDLTLSQFKKMWGKTKEEEFKRFGWGWGFKHGSMADSPPC